MASTKVQRIMTQPIKARIQIWLFEQKDLRIEGRIIGFDEYMNLVLEDAEEVNVKKNIKKTLGKEDFAQRRQHNFDDEYVSGVHLLFVNRAYYQFMYFFFPFLPNDASTIVFTQ
ncbi:hypothetical protein ZIOFF_016442 [Zingiber officinale]|uniref:Small nuclear ribonucleoprotein E n=1 Tax=Zingiber officinale TaxID=94328 RepID=A0A8J5LN97_ZINOF|nr:hypothetical protein ZIOFF_016442 [Zingiber officinale]